MGVYDCMYLVSKEQYGRNNQIGRSLETGGVHEVQESNVNNIEMSNGGTIVIESTPEVPASDILAGSVQSGVHPQNKVPGLRATSVGSNLQKTYGKRLVNKTKRKASRNVVGEDDEGELHGAHPPMDLAADSLAMNNANRRQNAILPRPNFVGAKPSPENLKRQAGVDDVVRQNQQDAKRQAISPNKQAMNQLMQNRLSQLQGGRKKQKYSRPTLDRYKRRGRNPPPSTIVSAAGGSSLAELGRSEKERNGDRRIIHEMRDLYRDKLKESAASVGLRGMTEKRHASTDGGETLFQAKRSNKRSHGFPVAIKRKSEGEVQLSKRAKNSHIFPMGGKRRRGEEEYEGEDVKRRRVDSNKYFPHVSKRKRTDERTPPSKRLKTYQHFPLEGKRKRMDDDDDDDVQKRQKTFQHYPLEGKRKRTGNQPGSSMKKLKTFQHYPLEGKRKRTDDESGLPPYKRRLLLEEEEEEGQIARMLDNYDDDD
jgi:hypothetical protein